MKRLLPFLKTNILTENVPLLLLLGLAPLLGGTTTLIGGTILGLCAIFVLVLTGISVSLVGKLLPTQVRNLSFMIIVAFYVTLCEILLSFFLPQIRDTLGIYLPLLTVSGLMFSRAASAEKEPAGVSALSGLGMGLGFFAVAFVMSFLRELLGAGTLFGLRIIPERYAMGMLVSPFGALILFALIITAVRCINSKINKEDSEK